jgi:hypothetical protein
MILLPVVSALSPILGGDWGAEAATTSRPGTPLVVSDRYEVGEYEVWGDVTVLSTASSPRR